MKLFRLIGAAFLAAMFHTSTSFAAGEEVHSGTVTYAKTAGGYTYLKVKEAGKESWLAALPMSVAVGDKVEYAGGDTMKDFKTKAMDQTFDSIRFVSRIHVANKDMPKDDFHKGLKPENKVAIPPKQGEIVKAKGGRNVAELFTDKDKLNGKNVQARARVIKVSKNIMGKNWVTLAEGTGKDPMTDGLPQVKLGMSLLYPYIRRDVKRILNENPCELFVSVHPGATYALMKLMGVDRPAFVSVVTELTNLHAVWYHPQTVLCLVPTEVARQRALRYGWLVEKVQVVGLPVSSQFCQPRKDRSLLRKRLDWPIDRPVVLLMGGGEGMGPLEETAVTLDKHCPEITLVIVTGRPPSVRFPTSELP